MTVFVGTSGWQYADWRPAFYPPKLPQRSWLRHFGERFQVVEVNNSFYQLPTRRRRGGGRRRRRPTSSSR